MTREISNDALTNHKFAITGRVSPEIEAQSVVIRISGRQLDQLNFGEAQNAQFLNFGENNQISEAEEVYIRESLSQLFETREERINRALLPFQKEKATKAVEEGKHVVFRYQS